MSWFAWMGALLMVSGCSSVSARRSDHFDGSRFFNPGAKVDKSFWQFLKWQWSRDAAEWPDWRDIELSSPDTSEPSVGEFFVTFINHATHLIRFPGLNVLTDPIYSERASPISWAGPKRIHEPGIPFDQLPRIDVVLVSHNHYDHMDADTVRHLSEVHNPLFVTPVGNKALLEDFGAKRVVELDWWEKTPIPTTNSLVTLVPARHWSSRSLFSRNTALWGGFVIEAGGHRVYFAGDTGYGDFFQDIAERFPGLSLSILPIGAYEPRWFMKEQHLNPADAVRAHLDLQSAQSMATHFGTFRMADEGPEDPSRELGIALVNTQVDPSRFVVPRPGERLRFGERQVLTPAVR